MPSSTLNSLVGESGKMDMINDWRLKYFHILFLMTAILFLPENLQLVKYYRKNISITVHLKLFNLIKLCLFFSQKA